MTPVLFAYARGMRAALSAPLWLHGANLAALVNVADPRAPRIEGADPAPALRAAHATLRLLARTRLPWWRNTCLYRAVVDCLVLRGYGIPSRVELGVTRPEDGGEIGAHAWVVRQDARAATPEALVVLR